MAPRTEFTRRQYLGAIESWLYEGRCRAEWIRYHVPSLIGEEDGRPVWSDATDEVLGRAIQAVYGTLSEFLPKFVGHKTCPVEQLPYLLWDAKAHAIALAHRSAIIDEFQRQRDEYGLYDRNAQPRPQAMFPALRTKDEALRAGEDFVHVTPVKWTS